MTVVTQSVKAPVTHYSGDSQLEHLSHITMVTQSVRAPVTHYSGDTVS
jgi:hypothetical protein